MKLLVDMNLAPRWADFLTAASWKAVHWSFVGKGDVPDTQIMAYARANDLVMLTHDLDFGAILAATNGEKPSVVQIRAEDTSPETIGGQVLLALQQLKAELANGALVTIEPARSRVRLLPLRQGDGVP